MKKILSSPLFFPLILVFLCLFIAFKNYTPDTFLTGWDTLHPEFNFPLNFSRLFFGVWRSDQGLGDVSGHSHMADLPRVFILWLFHFIFPLLFLRYSYIFLCLILGPLGFYFLVEFLLKAMSKRSTQIFRAQRTRDPDEVGRQPEGSEHEKFRVQAIRTIAFLGSLIYLFNLGTLQQFYVPFEMFPTQWAFLPWIILFSLRYLQKPSTFGLLTFELLTLFSAPQAYAAHLWYAFFAVYCLFLFIYSLSSRQFTSSIKLTLLILAINSFWLLPNISYFFSQTDNPRLNLTNRLHSQEFLLKNRQTGTLVDTSLLKGFYFDWDSYNFKRKSFQPLMSQWQDHLENYDVRLIGELIFFFSLVGLVLALTSKNRVFIALSPFFIVPFILLANRMPFFNTFFDLLLKIPILQETFRFIFTKLSVLLTFGYSLFLSFFIFQITTIFPKLLKLLLIFVPLSLLIYCYPFFQGQLISPIVKIPIPNDYFQLNSYLQSQSPGTVLTLPLHQTNGWTYTSWQYQGSGFIWFGAPQSFLDRDSDRWQSTNEEAFREFRTALYANNSNQFTNSLAKYRIGYILWDQSVIATSPKNRDQITFFNETERLLKELVRYQVLSSPQAFGSLLLYPVNTPPNLVEIKNITNYIGPSYRWHYFDFQNNTDYLTTNTPQDTYFPFRSILNDQNKINPDTISYFKLDQNPQILFSENQTVSAFNDTRGITLNLPDLSHRPGYIIGVNSEYLSGIPLRLCLKNSITSLCAVEEEITKNTVSHWDYFLVPPQDNFNGYNLELNTVSYGHQESTSILQQVTLAPLDFDSLSRLSVSPYLSQPPIGGTLSYHRLFPNNSLLKINPQTLPDNATLILNQSFDPGWLAFYFQGLKPVFLQNRLLVNNWANAWELPITNYRLPITVYIIFWPQLLEFLGLALIPPAFFLTWIILLPPPPSSTTPPPPPSTLFLPP